jgi:hypothetical protein
MRPWKAKALRMESKLAAGVRRLRPARGIELTEEVLWLPSTVGYRLYCHLHRPAETPKRHPALLLCPGGQSPGTVFDGQDAPIRAEDIARLGIAVLHFDPAGRGRSWGAEDHGGREHQDEVACLLAYLAGREDVDPERVAVLSIGEGLPMAAGGIAASRVPVRFLLDYEGPSDWETLTAGGSDQRLSAGRKESDLYFWGQRDASKSISGLGCSYIRLQAAVDHSRGGDLRHARRMMRAALEAGLPCQLNSHPESTLPERPDWLRPGPQTARTAMLLKLERLIVW